MSIRQRPKDQLLDAIVQGSINNNQRQVQLATQELMRRKSNFYEGKMRQEVLRDIFSRGL